VSYEGSWDALVFQLQQVFQEAKETTITDKMAVQVHDTVNVVLVAQNALELSWVSSPVNDMVSDAVLAIILQININPTAFPSEKPPNAKERQLEHLHKIENLLASYYGPVEVDLNAYTINLNFDGTDAFYNLNTQSVDCSDETLKEQIESVLKFVHAAVLPIHSRPAVLQEPKESQPVQESQQKQ